MRGELTVEPYLHVGEGQVYNPLTDRTLRVADVGFVELAALIDGRAGPQGLAAPVRDALVSGGFVVAAAGDLSTRSLLKYVSLEAHTVCNQACYFCPVCQPT